MTVFWAKYRGPGKATFAAPTMPVKDGRATTTVTFSEPGECILQSVVDDGSGETAGNFGYHCCWTNTQVTPRLSQAPGATPPPQTSRPTRRTSRRIFQAKCTNCHHPGTVAPMSLTNYQEVRPWARSIRTRVANREMPPWHRQDGWHSPLQERPLALRRWIATVVKWADNGAPQGNAADMPAAQTFRPEDEWHIGKPDIIVKMDGTHKMLRTGLTGGSTTSAIPASQRTAGSRRWRSSRVTARSSRHVVTYAMEPDAPAGTPAGGVTLHRRRRQSAATRSTTTPAAC